MTGTTSTLSAETWRPTRLSGALAAAVAVGFAAWAGAERGLLAPAVAGLATGALGAGALVTAEGDGLYHDLGSSLLAATAACGLVGSVLVGAARLPIQQVNAPVLPEANYVMVPTGTLLAVLPFVAALGAALGLRGGLDAETAGSGTLLLVAVVAPVALAAAVAWSTLFATPAELAAGALAAHAEVVAELTTPAGATGLDVATRDMVDLITPVGLGLLAALSVGALALVDPLAGLDRDLPGYRAARTRLVTGAPAVGALFAFALVLALALGPGGTAGFVAGLPGPLAGLAVGLADSVGLRLAMLGTAYLAGGLAAATVLLRRARRWDRWTVAHAAARATGGVVLLGGFAAAFAVSDPRTAVADALAENPEAAEMLAERSPEVVAALEGPYAGAFLGLLGLVAVLAILLAWWGVSAGLYVGLRTRVLPARAGGFAVAAAATFVLAGTVTFVGAAPSVLVGGVAIALVVWDLGEFAVGAGEEAGRRAPTTHGELVHVGAAFGLAAVAVAAALGLSTLTGEATGGLHAVGLLGSVAALALLLAAART